MNYNWYYNEFSQVGVDYSDIKNVSEYDEKMESIRDIDGEINKIVESIDIKDKNVLEVGTGTGRLAVEIANLCRNVYAIDVSEIMIDFARERADKHGLNNIYFYQDGFLSYEHEEESLDVIITQLALHHLPDFWKAIALKNMYQMLKKDGQLYLHDVIFSFDIDKYDIALNEWIESGKDESGDKIAKDIAIHIKEEYSTFADIMGNLILKAGFEIENVKYNNRFFTTYVCTKN